MQSKGIQQYGVIPEEHEDLELERVQEISLIR